MTERTRDRSLWHMIAAPLVWSLHFVAVYAWTATVCAKAGDAGLARTGILVGTAAALIAIVAIGWVAWRQWDYTDDWDYVHDKPTEEHRREFLGHVGALLALISAIGVVFNASPAVFIGNCL